MAQKQELLDTMQAMRAELDSAIAGYDGRLDTDMGGGWRLRDVLAHIALWERMAARKIAGTPLPDGEELLVGPWDLDRFNEAMRERWRGRRTDEVLAELEAAHQALVAAVERASDEECAPRARVWAVVDEDGAGHYPMHFPVRDLLAQRAARVD
jgi:hypothetical protein